MQSTLHGALIVADQRLTDAGQVNSSGACLFKACFVAAQVLRSPTRYTLAAMVSHFQKLFDVTSLSGVYPRMNEVYTRLGEMTNAMRNLREALELGTLEPESKLHVSFSQFWIFVE